MTQTATQAQSPDVLVIRRVFKASPARVFAAWTEADQVRHWMGPAGITCRGAKTDPRVGGAFTFPMVEADGSTHTAVGAFSEVTPPADGAPGRLAFTWSWIQDHGGPGQRMEIVLDFQVHPDGCEMTLTPTNFIDDDARTAHNRGWDGSFDKLEAHLVG